MVLAVGMELDITCECRAGREVGLVETGIDDRVRNRSARLEANKQEDIPIRRQLSLEFVVWA